MLSCAGSSTVFEAAALRPSCASDVVGHVHLVFTSLPAEFSTCCVWPGQDVINLTESAEARKWTLLEVSLVRIDIFEK